MNTDAIGTNFYSKVKNWLIGIGYQEEIEWQSNQTPENTTEKEFLREAAWVIYCSGFRETTVRQYFDYLSLCFFDWNSAKEISASSSLCVAAAMRGLANRRKHEAIVTISSHISDQSFARFKRNFLDDPISVFTKLPYLGPVTSLHLAKNLGFKVAKPDRHLVRLKDYLGFDDVDEMCKSLSRTSGDAIQVVDLVLWRYMERRASHHPHSSELSGLLPQ